MTEVIERRPRVLVVDDSATVRDQLRQALDPAGYEVVEARDGVEGLAAVRDNNDLAMIICDVHMPRMDGIQLITTLHGEGNELPVLMLTTEGQAQLIRQAKAAGARGWIVKPFDAGLLAKAVQSIID